MKTSASGRAAIERREGKRLTAYRDSVGVLTIGIGHTGRMAPPLVSAGMRITDAECDAMLAADLAPVEHVLNTAVRVPLTQNEFDALASLGFNIGAAGLRRSLVIRRLNQGDIHGAANAFMDWAKPAVLAGRRREEMAQFLAQDPRGEDVAAVRAQVLAVKAGAAASTARRAQAGGAVLVLAGMGTMLTRLQAHHNASAWIIGGTALMVAAIFAFGRARNRFAATLAANAAQQAVKTRAPAAPTPQPKSQTPRRPP